ncbi:MAG: alkaline phosphatase family protein [bacterium]
MSENKKINRREFITKSAKAAAGIATVSQLGNKIFAAPVIKNTKRDDKVFILGIDGMDPGLLNLFIQKGMMPNFKKFLHNNYFSNLRTTLPPQSPVAWASFISGANPGVHGIYDFVHRDPAQFIPFLSTSRTYEPENSIDIGSWSIPLKSGKVELLRKGPTFWSALEKHDIPVWLYKLPANYPVTEGKAKQISGLGTPDLLGTYGTFTLFTENRSSNLENVSGGRVVYVRPQEHQYSCKLEGPTNPLNKKINTSSITFSVNRDPWEDTIKITIQGKELVLAKGEWTTWIPIEFKLLPLIATVHGMVRFYVQHVHPYLRLYVSPINVDPKIPDSPLSNPREYSQKLSDGLGRFYTQGFPEDTKALSHDIFSDDEFLVQSKAVLDERLKAFDYLLNRFNKGLFFFYFSSIDQNSHMLLRTMNPSHPLYDFNATPQVKNAVPDIYKAMDNVLGKTLTKMDNRSTLFILSDHGFSPFTREFNVSTWLVENGFTAVTDRSRYHKSVYFDYVNWDKTKAYVIGLNSIYINLYGREMHGSVLPEERDKIVAEIIHKLRNVKDPKTGQKVVVDAYDTKDIYSGPQLNLAPDIVIGYAKGYRISDYSVLGKFPKEIIGDRTDKWSSDHCMHPDIVPGVLLCNREIKKQAPGLWDLAPSILERFGFPAHPLMDGRSVFHK